MQLKLHKNARTIPAIRRELQLSTKSDRELANEYNLNRATVHKWRNRDNTTGVTQLDAKCLILLGTIDYDVQSQFL